MNVVGVPIGTTVMVRARSAGGRCVPSWIRHMRTWFGAMLVATALSCGQAHAQTVVASGVYDLNRPDGFSSTSFGNYDDGSYGGFVSYKPVSVAPGDTYRIDFTFANGLGVQADSIDRANITVWDYNPMTGGTNDGQPFANIRTTGRISLLDASGNAIFTSATQSENSGSVHVGTFADYSVDQPVTFYGVRYDGVLDTIDGNVTRNYNLPVFQVSGTNLVQVAAAAPEPATWGLMIFGFGVAGYALRRRKAVAGAIPMITA